MTDEEARTIKLPPWLPVAFAIFSVAGGAAASWYDVKTDVALLEQRVAFVEKQAAEAKVEAASQTKAMAELRDALADLRSDVRLIGVALKIPVFSPDPR